MRSVSPFEANLLRLLRAVLRRAADVAGAADLGGQTRPDCLSRDCVELVKQSLATGCADWLIRAGGWRRERFLREQRVVEGRAWERREPESIGLSFSKSALEFLIWLTSANISDATQRWRPIDNESLTLGDQLLFFLTYQALRNTEIADRWCGLAPFRNHGLCMLTFADDWGEQKVTSVPDFEIWVSEPGAGVLEALQGTLADRWIEMEGAKSRIMSADRMRSIGETQARVLDTFLDRVDQAGRRDLARFLLVAAKQMFRHDAPVDQWIGSLDVASLRIADRLETYRAAVATLSRMGRLRRWAREAHNIAYHDEQYAASQLWKSDWERYDADVSTERLLAVVRAVEPMT